jgi:hypothetical protein
VHFGLGSEKFGLLEHFGELCFIDLSFGFFLNLVDLLEVGDIIIEEFFLITNLHEGPSLIILAHFNARLPLSIGIDRLSLEKLGYFFLFLIFF